MKRIVTTITAAALATTALTGCSSTSHTEDVQFVWQGSRLAIVNDNPNMPVTVRSGASGTVTVEVSTTTVVKHATTPAWTLVDDTLDLDTPCGKGYVGICEGSYSVAVPSGTKVTVNGDDVAGK